MRYSLHLFINRFIVFALIVGGLAVSEAKSQFHLSTDLLEESLGLIPLLDGWKYNSLDSSHFKAVDYDASEWRSVERTRLMPGQDRDFVEWLGWFRLDMQVDSSLWGEVLTCHMGQEGALEMYFNGRLVRRMGSIGATPGTTTGEYHILPQPFSIRLDSLQHQVIAVRYAVEWESRRVMSLAPYGFRLTIGDNDAVISDTIHKHHEAYLETMFFEGIFLSFCVIHLFLFIFNRKEIGNLFFSMICFSFGLLVFAILFMQLSGTAFAFTLSYIFVKTAVILVSLSSLAFFHSLFHEGLPKAFWMLTAVAVPMLIGILYVPMVIVTVFSLLCMAIALIFVVGAMIQRREGSLFIGIGFFLYIAFNSLQMLLPYFNIDIEAGHRPFENSYLIGSMIILLTMSIHLARKVGQSTRELRNQIVQIRDLSSEKLVQERRANEEEMRRKTLELENEKKEIELEEAKHRQKLLIELEKTNEELRQTQAQLVHSEKMAALGNLTAGIAHEINTPIGAMFSTHDTLEKAVKNLHTALQKHLDVTDENSFDSTLQHSLQAIENVAYVIRTGGKRVTEIVKRMKSFARLDEAELKLADLHTGLEDTLLMMHHELTDDIEVVKDYGDLPEIKCYPGALNQVFLNLLVNARQAIGKKGTITISTEKLDNDVVITISDTGSGIPKKNLTRIFEPGFTTKGVGVGTGLGLAIVYRIIKDHDGTIDVQSEPGKGTTFTISIPVQ